jgi:hypothetical protein
MRATAYKLAPADIPLRLYFSSVLPRPIVVHVVWNTRLFLKSLLHYISFVRICLQMF